MIQLILHLVGDYILQTDYQAKYKKTKGKKGFFACLVHCTTYSLPFLFFYNYKAAIAIFFTHFIIDRTNIILRFIAFKNSVSDLSNFGSEKDKPFALSIWLYIITDNIFHIICNYLSIKYL